jgi:hypothetical protein
MDFNEEGHSKRKFGVNPKPLRLFPGLPTRLSANPVRKPLGKTVAFELAHCSALVEPSKDIKIRAGGQ